MKVKLSRCNTPIVNALPSERNAVEEVDVGGGAKIITWELSVSYI